MVDEYTKRLENIIKQMLQPLRGIPFNLVIEALTGHRVFKFDKTNHTHLGALEKLRLAALEAGLSINRSPIKRKRANEVGNDIEDYILCALHRGNIQADIPTTKFGKKKVAGYPDIIFWYDDIPFYIECKTFKIDALSSSFRTFYFSPADDMKVTFDAVHFLLSFEMDSIVDKDGGYRFICKHFKIISLEALSLDVKYEFNSDNKRLYSGIDGAPILIEEDIK